METIANDGGHQVGTTKNRTGRFGRLGLDVGVFGRWSRLIWGVAILLPLAFGAVRDLQKALSFILQRRIRYGGCEVVALPILLSKRRYTTYCIPLVALDAVEKVVVERLPTNRPG